MAYTNVWTTAAPLDTQAANQGAVDFRATKLDVMQRIASFGAGLLAARPTPEVTSASADWTGVMYWATDTLQAFRWNGAAWDDISTSLPTATASALATTGAAVNVSLAVPPTTGQILVATDPTHATWQNPSAIVASGGYKIETVQSANVTVTNTTVETTLFTFILPANELAVNQILRIHASGVMTELAVDGTQLSLRLYIDGLALVNVNTIGNANYTNAIWTLDSCIMCKTAGIGGIVDINGFYTSMTDAGPSGNVWPSGDAFNLAFDTTIAHVIKLTVVWAAGVTASDIATGRQFFIERLN